MKSTNPEKKIFWQQHADQHKACGLSKAKYCRDNELKYVTFNYWVKRLSVRASEFIPVKVQLANTHSDNSVLCTLEFRGCLLKIQSVSALSFILDRMAK